MKTYVVVGTGGRAPMFIDPIARDYRDSARLLALCDPSATRMEYHRERLQREYGALGIRCYASEDFDCMLDELRPDFVIVCTVDAFHARYILRSIEKGCDVICEKPITTDAAQCRSLLESVKANGPQVRVTLNMRWMPGLSAAKKLIASKAIGDVKHVHLEYLLDTSHGADYFRRWHSEKASSGGLLVHKSTHHFDVVNWLIDGIPESVYAAGSLVFYGKENAIRRGDDEFTRYERYADAPTQTDPFHLDIRGDEAMKRLYWEAEAETGYVRDRNVFREKIDIEDSMSVVVKYRGGAMLSYSLNAFGPYEGYRVHISGDRGRLEYEERLPSHIIRGGGDALALSSETKSWRKLMHLPLFEPPREIPIEELSGSHGGGDRLLQEQLFSAHPPPDSLNRTAGHEQAIASAIIGIAANESIATGLPVNINERVDFPSHKQRLSQLR